MLLTMMKAKLHRATVTRADMHYEGSISIDRDFLDAAGMLPHEQVDVLNITTGARFTTYTIEAPRGTRTIGINGA
ncbi:MAG: aspartate 1-decarboxylase, partial [Sulfurifustaceae bacterium]